MAAQPLISLRYPTRGARKVIDAQARRLPAGFGIAMDNAAEIYRQSLVAYTPVGVGEHPGRLRAGWRVRRVSAGGRASRHIYNTERYLKYVLAGRGAIDQRGRPNAKRLRFVVSGIVFYRWRVGPAKANPFHLRAARAARAQVREQIRADLRSILAQVHQP